MASPMDREHIPLRKKLMSVNLKKANLMALASVSIKMVRATKANTKMTCGVGRGCSLILKGLSTRGTGLMTCSMVKVLRHM